MTYCNSTIPEATLFMFKKGNVDILLEGFAFCWNDQVEDSRSSKNITSLENIQVEVGLDKQEFNHLPLQFLWQKHYDII